MRHLCYILIVALAVGNLTCKRTPKRDFDMQKSLEAQGVSIRKIALNPIMLAPFLDSKNVEEAALKEFLRGVDEVNVFFLPSREVVDGVAARAQAAGYVQYMDFRQDSARCMWVYVQSVTGEETNRLILLLQESHKVFYGVEVCGSVAGSTLANLRRISPTFIDRYIRRFNVKF